jgi:hypothetical protein
MRTYGLLIVEMRSVSKAIVTLVLQKSRYLEPDRLERTLNATRMNMKAPVRERSLKDSRHAVSLVYAGGLFKIAKWMSHNDEE